MCCNSRRRYCKCHRKVNQGYLDIAKENPERCVVIPEGDIASVQRNMRTEFFRRYLSGI